MKLGTYLHGDPQTSTPGITIGPGRAYEVFSTIAFAGRRRRVFATLVRLSGAQPGHQVLDVGCGPGYLTRLAAAAVSPGGTALGIDPSPSVIDYANHITTQPGCTFRLGVAESLDVPDTSFDIVLSSLVVHHVPEHLRAPALREMYRALRPGGRLVIADFRPPTSRLVRHVLGAATDPAMQRNPIHLLEGLVRDAGFDVLDRGDLRPYLHYVQARRPGSGR